MLKKGFQIPEIAVRLGKSESILRWRLNGNELLNATSGPPKKGRFTIEEVEYLLEMWQYGIQPPEIVKRLGRSSDGVSRQLSQLADQIRIVDTPPVHHGPQALSPEIEESIFQARLKELWVGLLRLEMTETWRDTLSRETPESWLSDIARGIPTEVKKLLASHEPPTVEKLEQLSWIDTKDVGVYAWLLKPRAKLHLNSHCFLYVGSGTGVGHGLQSRKEAHLSEHRHNPRLLRIIKQRKLQKDGCFITLMMTEMKGVEREDLIRMRCLVTLAESMLTMWLAALGEEHLYKGNFDSLCPWGVSQVSYSGCTSHNPLTKDITVGLFESPKR